MNDINRRDFLKKIGLATGVIASSSLLLSLEACSTKNKTKSASSINHYAAIRVSSDVYKSDLLQRFAFAVFKSENHVSKEPLEIILKKPDGKTSTLKNVQPRNSGLKTQGIYSFEYKFTDAGQYEISSNYDGKEISLAFVVNETNIAPALDAVCIASDSPTNTDPKDAKVLCTRFEGNCGLHEHTISDLLNTNEPFIVMFATPARCQTSYCGPVLEILKKELETNKINAIHIEIYKNETSNETLETVTQWNLPSEPWLFAVNSSGKIVKRLDGAFDLSEIQECISAAKS